MHLKHITHILRGILAFLVCSLIIGILIGILFFDNKIPIDTLIADLRNPDSSVRLKAANALIDRKAPSAVQPLIDVLLHDDEKNIRRAAAMALGSQGDSRAIQPLIQSFKDDWARKQAALAIARSGPAAVPPLIAAITNSDSSIRQGAALALAQIADPRASEILDKALKDHDWEVISAGCDYFIHKGDKETLDSLVEALNKSDNLDTATAFLNSGNIILSGAASAWAKKRGYRIISVSGGKSVKWGK